MNREDIIRMAREANNIAQRDDFNQTAWVFGDDALERFAVLVAAAEREACAKLCIEMGTESMEWQPSTLAVRPEHFAVAQAVRARRDRGGK